MSLVGWYPLINNSLKDYAGQLGDLTATNTSVISYSANGKIGSTFNNTSHTAGTLLSTNKINLGPNQSMFCWVKLNDIYSLSSLNAIMGQHRYNYNGTNKGCNMGLTIKYVSSTAGYLSVNTSTPSGRTFNTYVGGTLLSTGKWYHLGYTYDGTTIRLYVDGDEDGSYSLSDMVLGEDYFGAYMWSLSGTSLGTRSAYGNYVMTGCLNDIRIYNHTLSLKEIKELSRALVIHYSFNGRPVDYLEFTGTQFLSTGVVGPAVWEFDMQWTVTGTRQLQGYGPSSDEYWGVQTSGNYGLFNGDSAIKAGNRDFITHDYETGKILINGNLARTTGTASANGKTYGLGNLGAGGSYGCTFKLYRCRCIQNGILIRDFIPWEQNGVKGLKDTKSGTFYTNSGSGTFGGIISNSNNTLLNNAGYDYSGLSKGASLTYDTACGLYSMACTGSWYGWGSTSASTGASWNDAVYVQSDLGLSMTPTEFTVSWWFKYYSYNYGSWINLSGDSNNGGTYDKNASTLSDYDGTWKLGGTSLNSTFNINTSGWHHYAITAKNGGQARLYRDGVLIQSNTLTTNLGPFQYVLLGCGYAGGVVRPMRGLFGDFKLFMKELSENDVKDLYHSCWAVDGQGQVFSNTLNEGQSKLQITKGGVNSCNFLSEVIQLNDGSYWLQVTHHNNRSKTNLFSSTDSFGTSFVYHNDECWSDFPIIKNMGSYDGNNYEFLAVEQQGTSPTILIRRWRQSISPFSASWNDVKPGSSKVTHISNMPSGAGGMYVINSSTYMCVANSSNGNWFGAFGAWSTHGDGIPTLPSGSTSGIFDLYVRVSPTSAKRYREFKNGISMPNTFNEI